MCARCSSSTLPRARGRLELIAILRQGRSSDAAQASTARIVVVGDQSHGKTSLLEALSTVDLPRGEGIKTRCPLVLQLRGLREGGGSECAFISAPEIAEQRIGDLSRIPRAVEEMTERLAGTPKDLIALDCDLIALDCP